MCSQILLLFSSSQQQNYFLFILLLLPIILSMKMEKRFCRILRGFLLHIFFRHNKAQVQKNNQNIKKWNTFSIKIQNKKHFKTMNIEQRQKPKPQVDFEVTDDELEVEQMRKQIRINHNILDFPEQENLSFGSQQNKKKQRRKSQLPNNQLMDQCLFQYMVFYRLIAIVCVTSLIISLTTIYAGPHYNTPIYLNNLLTVFLLCLLLFRYYFWLQLCEAKQAHESGDLMGWVQLVLVMIHPTIWTGPLNSVFHLAIILRGILPFKYLIYESSFYDSRAYRIIQLYGLNSKEHFFFAFKSLLTKLSIMEVLCFQFFCIILLTHCLYLVSIDNQTPTLMFLDCLEVVIVTIPTVGFGEYKLPFLAQKIVVTFIIIFGILLSSFIILAMLNQFGMNEKQVNSYELLKKIQAKQKIENLCQEYIRQSMGNIRDKKSEDEKLSSHISFRTKYKQHKSLYSSISYVDMDYLFSYFREGLRDLQLKIKETQNMMIVLVKKMYTQECSSKIRPFISSTQRKQKFITVYK